MPEMPGKYWFPGNTVGPTDLMAQYAQTAWNQLECGGGPLYMATPQMWRQHSRLSDMKCPKCLENKVVFPAINLALELTVERKIYALTHNFVCNNRHSKANR